MGKRPDGRLRRRTRKEFRIARGKLAAMRMWTLAARSPGATNAPATQPGRFGTTRQISPARDASCDVLDWRARAGSEPQARTVTWNVYPERMSNPSMPCVESLRPNREARESFFGRGSCRRAPSRPRRYSRARAVRLPPERERELEATLGATETAQESSRSTTVTSAPVSSKSETGLPCTLRSTMACAPEVLVGTSTTSALQARPSGRAAASPNEVDLPAARGDDIRAENRRTLVNRRDDVMEREVAADARFPDRPPDQERLTPAASSMVARREVVVATRRCSKVALRSAEWDDPLSTNSTTSSQGGHGPGVAAPQNVATTCGPIWRAVRKAEAPSDVPSLAGKRGMLCIHGGSAHPAARRCSRSGNS